MTLSADVRVESDPAAICIYRAYGEKQAQNGNRGTHIRADVRDIRPCSVIRHRERFRARLKLVGEVR
jgi:hypothetical protein